MFTKLPLEIIAEIIKYLTNWEVPVIFQLSDATNQKLKKLVKIDPKLSQRINRIDHVYRLLPTAFNRSDPSPAVLKFFEDTRDCKGNLYQITEEEDGTLLELLRLLVRFEQESDRTPELDVYYRFLKRQYPNLLKYIHQVSITWTYNHMRPDKFDLFAKDLRDQFDIFEKIIDRLQIR